MSIVQSRFLFFTFHSAVLQRSLCALSRVWKNMEFFVYLPIHSYFFVVARVEVHGWTVCTVSVAFLWREEVDWGYESQSTCSLHRCFPATDIMDHLHGRGRRESTGFSSFTSTAKVRSWLSYPRCRRWSIWRKGKEKISSWLFVRFSISNGLCGWTLRSMECC